MSPLLEGIFRSLAESSRQEGSWSDPGFGVPLAEQSAHREAQLQSRLVPCAARWRRERTRKKRSSLRRAVSCRRGRQHSREPVLSPDTESVEAFVRCDDDGAMRDRVRGNGQVEVAHPLPGSLEPSLSLAEGPADLVVPW